MTKADIAKELYERNYKWLSRNEATDMVELLLDTLKETLAEGKMVKIAGFGTLWALWQHLSHTTVGENWHKRG